MPTTYSWPLVSVSSGSSSALTGDGSEPTFIDLDLVWDNAAGAADLSVEGNDLAQASSLQTAIYLSLFLDRRAEESDILPDGETDRRGWWGDAHPNVDGDQIGSRLWLLSRSKQTQETLTRAEDYAREALQWLIDDAVSDEITVTASIPQTGVLGLEIGIRRPDADPINFRYSYAWASLEARST